MDYTNQFFIQAQGLLERTVRAKRPEILKFHGRIDAEFKGDNTPVTILDKELEQELRKALTDFDSSIGLNGEEYGVEGNTETYWLIDPIDGTDNFIRGLPGVRNMVTLIDKNQPIFAFVYKPISDELYVAAKGDGTYKNGVKQFMVERPLSRSLVELAAPLNKDKAIRIWSELYKKVYGYKIADFLQVVEGKLDAHLVYSSVGSAWDYAPRALLIAEAGGKVANIGKDDYRIDDLDFLAAHPSIFDELMATIVGAEKS